MNTNQITSQIIGAAMKVHTAVGPGLLERPYALFLAAEIRRRGLRVQEQVEVPVMYAGEEVDLGYRLDLLVENEIIVEVKAVAAILDVHRAQLLSYLRLGEKRVGLLLNFHEVHMRDGITRLVNGW